MKVSELIGFLLDCPPDAEVGVVRDGADEAQDIYFIETAFHGGEYGKSVGLPSLTDETMLVLRLEPVVYDIPTGA